MRNKVFVIVYICLVCIFIAANELVLNVTGTQREGIVLLFLTAAFIGRCVLKDNGTGDERKKKNAENAQKH